MTPKLSELTIPSTSFATLGPVPEHEKVHFNKNLGNFQIFFPIFSASLAGVIWREDLKDEFNETSRTFLDYKGLASLQESSGLWENCPKLDVPQNLHCIWSQDMVYDWLKKSSDLLWQCRSRARTIESFFRMNEHLLTWKQQHQGKKKKRINPHVTGLQNPIVEAQSSAPRWGGWRDTRASLPGLWEELRKEPSHHFWPAFREAPTGSRRSHQQVSSAAFCK